MIDESNIAWQGLHWTDFLLRLLVGVTISIISARIASRHKYGGNAVMVILVILSIIIISCQIIFGGPLNFLPSPLDGWIFIILSTLPWSLMFLPRLPPEDLETDVAVKKEVSKAVWNERLKLTASFVDRLGTTIMTVGAATPGAAYYFNISHFAETINLRALVIAVLGWSAVGIICHVGARTILGGMRD
jgi:hypothetical protein